MLLDFTTKISDYMSQDITGDDQSKMSKELKRNFCALICALANRCQNAEGGSAEQMALEPYMRRNWAVCGWAADQGSEATNNVRIADYCLDTRGAEHSALLCVLFDNDGEPTYWAEADCDLPEYCNAQLRNTLELPREACNAMHALLCGGGMFDASDASSALGADASIAEREVIERVFSWADSIFKQIHNEHAAQPRGVCKDPAIERAAQNVKTKLLGILREFILTNVQRNMVALKPCIERACGRKWCNAEHRYCHIHAERSRS